jgi:hypothetical protein
LAGQQPAKEELAQLSLEAGVGKCLQEARITPRRVTTDEVVRAVKRIECAEFLDFVFVNALR